MCYFNMLESLWHPCLPEGFDMQHIFWCATAAAVSFLIESTIIIYGNGHRGDVHRSSAKFPQLCQSPQPHSHCHKTADLYAFQCPFPLLVWTLADVISGRPLTSIYRRSGGILLGHERTRTSGQQRIPKSSGQTAMVRIGRVQ